MNLGDLTFSELIGAVVVVLLLMGVYNTVMTAIKNHLEAKKRHDAPVDTLSARVDAHDRMLASDKRRLEEMEDRVAAIRKESGLTLRGVRALLSHEINGNSVDKLRDNAACIDEYLIDKE